MRKVGKIIRGVAYKPKSTSFTNNSGDLTTTYSVPNQFYYFTFIKRLTKSYTFIALFYPQNNPVKFKY